VSRQSAIDNPVSLSQLLSAADLDEIAKSYAELHGVPISIRDVEGTLAITAGLGKDRRSGAQQRRALIHEGHELGEVIIGPYEPTVVSDENAADVAEHLVRVLVVLVHAAYARHLTAQVHVAAMDDAYNELAAKNERLAEAVERLQEVDRLKSNFLATVSHELRTPLTSVIGYSEMLIEGLAGDLNDEQHDYVKTILGKADQLLQLITGILDVSMIESGSLRIANAPVAIDTLIANVVDTFEPHARNQGIDIVRPQPLGMRAMGDEKKIQQIVTHLVTNAIKFTRSGGNIDVLLELGPLSRETRSGRFGRPDSVDDAVEPIGVRVSVTDSGIGISPEKQPHIFEPFFQVDSSSTREYGGTGLGLTLVKSYAEAHGGRVWVASELGRGSRFTVSLPLVPEDLETYLAGHPPPS
jgi:signal transduction histidine kinase